MSCLDKLWASIIYFDSTNYGRRELRLNNRQKTIHHLNKIRTYYRSKICELEKSTEDSYLLGESIFVGGDDEWE